MEPGPQHLCGHSRAHTSAQILGHLGDWGMSLILGLWLMVALIGGWGPQQRLGHTCSQLEKQTRGHPATSSISWKRFLVQHGLGHDGRHVWEEQAGATHETGFGFFDVGVAVGRAVTAEEAGLVEPGAAVLAGLLVGKQQLWGHGVAHIWAQLAGHEEVDGVATAVTEVDGLTTCTPVTLALQQSWGQTVRQNLRQIGLHSFFGVAGFGVTTGATVPGLLTQGYPG